MLVPRARWDVFFGSDLGTWLDSNLATKLIGVEENWDCVFGVSLWQIWQRRNNYVFNGVSPMVDRKLNEVYLARIWPLWKISSADTDDGIPEPLPAKANSNSLPSSSVTTPFPVSALSRKLQIQKRILWARPQFRRIECWCSCG
ncbi:LL-diaminopimelate aminotransferase [Striga asiatica]|uniref:LL-diaminopimelate aminotransferase n=1 Tax=Striga asiatica TaxID=4170 RepID=A0A5A7PW30_STRAF|nr:LL-diaminopimelate aminotransferase [Striga asiatica]